MRFSLATPPRAMSKPTAKGGREAPAPRGLPADAGPEEGASVVGFEQLTLGDVARRLGLSLSTVHNYRYQGRLPAPDGTLGNSPWWLPETIDAWQASRPGRGVGGGRPRRDTPPEKL